MLTNGDIIELIVRIGVYCLAIVVSFIAVYAIDFSKFTRKVSPFFKYLLVAVITLGLAFLLGSLFLAFLPDFSRYN